MCKHRADIDQNGPVCLIICKLVQVLAPHVHVDVDASVYPGSLQGSADFLSCEAFSRICMLPSNVRVRHTDQAQTSRASFCSWPCCLSYKHQQGGTCQMLLKVNRNITTFLSTCSGILHLLMIWVCHCGQVVSLELRNMCPSAEQMQDVVRLKQLRALYIKDSVMAPCGMDDEAFAMLVQLPLLQRLSVRAVSSRVSEEGLIKGLQGLTQLQSLELISVAQVGPPQTNLPMWSSKLQTIAEKAWEGEKDGANFTSIKCQCDFIRTRWLDCCSQISDNAVQTLHTGWQELESLYLTKCHLLTDASLAVIGSLPSLFQLFLCGSDNFSARGLESVSQNISLVNIRN